jgi:hypothetical protein
LRIYPGKFCVVAFEGQGLFISDWKKERGHAGKSDLGFFLHLEHPQNRRSEPTKAQAMRGGSLFSAVPERNAMEPACRGTPLVNKTGVPERPHRPAECHTALLEAKYGHNDGLTDKGAFT